MDWAPQQPLPHHSSDEDDLGQHVPFEQGDMEDYSGHSTSEEEGFANTKRRKRRRKKRRQLRRPGPALAPLAPPACDQVENGINTFIPHNAQQH